jgi:hypothetical protein
MSDAFWIDDEFDRSAASDGISRYGAYVRGRIPGGFDECWDGTFELVLAERFAALAWHTGTTPVMAPPYVHRHPVVLSARVEVNLEAEDPSRRLTAVVDVASRWPAALEKGWEGARCWRQWIWENRLGTSWPREPDGDELARGDCFALPSLRLAFAVPAGDLPAVPVPPHARGQVELAAREAVAVLVAELNQVVGPVLSALERS